MKVVVALASSARQISGVQRHAINIARSLLTQSELKEVHLIAAPWQMHFIADALPMREERLHLHAAPIGASNVSRNIWYYRDFPRLARDLRADIVHFAYPAPLRIHAFRCPVTVTLHDMYPFDLPENFGFPKVLFNRMVLLQCLRAANSIACVSESTLSRLERIEPLLALAKACIVPNCVEPCSQTASVSPLPSSAEDPFLLCVAQHRRNKNLLLLLRAFSLLVSQRRLSPETKLVIVGIRGPETAAIEQLLEAACLGPKVVLLEGISEAELQWCYRHCALLVAPSLVEGFGLPIAEAILAGCPVLCSDIPAFREVGGSRCRYIALGHDAEQHFARAIEDAFANQRPEPAALPHLRASAIGRQYLQLYGTLLAPAARLQAMLSRASIRNPERTPVL